MREFRPEISLSFSFLKSKLIPVQNFGQRFIIIQVGHKWLCVNGWGSKRRKRFCSIIRALFVIMLLLLSSLNGLRRKKRDLFIHLGPLAVVFPLIDVDHQKVCPRLRLSKWPKRRQCKRKKKNKLRDNSKTVKGSRYIIGCVTGWLVFSHLFSIRNQKSQRIFFIFLFFFFGFGGQQPKKRQVKVTTTWWMAITHRQRRDRAVCDSHTKL